MTARVASKPRRRRTGAAADFTGKRLVPTIRVSQRKGREGEAFMSPEDQKDRITRRARELGVKLLPWVDETDSVSGGSMEREGLNYALDLCRKGKADGIIVAKMDRFSRTLPGGLRTIGDMEAEEYLLLSADEGVIVGPEPADRNQKLMRGIWLLLAEWQRDSLMDSWDATRARHIGYGIHTQEPYGYVKDETRRLVPRDGEGEHVAPTFEARAAGMSWHAIADLMTERGARTRGGAFWTHTTARNIVHNRVYLGEISSGEYVNANAHPPLVTREQWDAAHAMNAPNLGRALAEFYLLSGFIRCASCGQRMKGTRVNGYRYYACRRRFTWGRCTRAASINAEQLEAYVCEQFLGHVAGLEAEGRPDSGALTAARAHEEGLRAEVRDYLTSETSLALKRLDRSLWDEGHARLVHDLAAAQEAVTEAEIATRGFALPADLPALWPNLDGEARRPYLADVFVAVVVGPSNKTKRVALVDRVRLIRRGERNAPENFPTAKCSPIALRPDRPGKHRVPVA